MQLDLAEGDLSEAHQVNARLQAALQEAERKLAIAGSPAETKELRAENKRLTEEIRSLEEQFRQMQGEAEDQVLHSLLVCCSLVQESSSCA